jgi:hypothetical protein
MKTKINTVDHNSLNSSQYEKYFRQKLRKSKHMLRSITFFENHAVSEIMWGKMWYGQTGHRWQYNTAHAVRMLGN